MRGCPRRSWRASGACSCRCGTRWGWRTDEMAAKRDEHPSGLPSELMHMDPRAVDVLTSTNGRTPGAMTADTPHGFDSIEFIVSGEAERWWALHRDALIREARRRGVPCCWGEQNLDEPRRSEGGGGEE